MAIESRTVGSVVESVAFMLLNTQTADTTLTEEIKKHLGYTMQYMVLHSEMPAFRTEATISLVDGTSTYDLPDDFVKIIEPSVHFDASPKWTLTYLPYQEYVENTMQEWLSEEQRPFRYTIRHRDSADGLWQILFIPTPDTSYTVRYTYFASPTVISESTADATQLDYRFPRDLVQALAWGTALCFPQYLGRDQMIDYDAKYQEALRQLRRTQDPIVGYAYQRDRYKMQDRRHNNTWNDTIYSGNPIR